MQTRDIRLNTNQIRVLRAALQHLAMLDAEAFGKVYDAADLDLNDPDPDACLPDALIEMFSDALNNSRPGDLNSFVL